MASVATRAAGPVSAGEDAVLAALGGDSADVDTLVARTAMASDAVVAALTDLELTGRVAALPGGLWQRLHGDEPSGPSRAHVCASRTRARWAA